MDKTPPPIEYGRDCMQFMGHVGGVIPEDEIEEIYLELVGQET